MVFSSTFNFADKHIDCRLVLTTQPKAGNGRSFKEQDASARDIEALFGAAYSVRNSTRRSVETMQRTISVGKVPLVGLEVNHHRSNNGPLIGTVPKDALTSSKVRVVIDLPGGLTDVSEHLLAGQGVSHLILFRPSESKGELFSVGTANAVGINGQMKVLPAILHDLLMDISMYWSWRETLNECFSGGVLSRDFNVAKFNFFVHQKLRVPYLFNLSDSPAPCYVSLAGAAREKAPRGTDFSLNEAECRRLEELWLEFLAPYLVVDVRTGKRPGFSDHLDRDAWIRELKGAPSARRLIGDPVDLIFKLHKNKGELSRRKLSRAIDKLVPGNYLLGVVRKRPDQRRERAAVTDLFKHKVYRKNLCRTFRPQELSQIGRLAQYCVFFWFPVARKK